jgi:hypothetical protein
VGETWLELHAHRIHGSAVFINRLTLFFARELISVSLTTAERLDLLEKQINEFKAIS